MLLRIVATLAAGSLLAACGFKGPLYLPRPEAGGQPAQSSQPPAQPATPAAGSAAPSDPAPASK